MNFIEFYENVTKMKQHLTKQGLPLDEVNITHTRSSGEDIIAAFYGENIIDYFKW